MKLEKLSLTWIPESEGRCGNCDRWAKLFQAFEQENKALPGLCGFCLQVVDDMVNQRRKAKGMECHFCNEREKLVGYGVTENNVVIMVYVCPKCKAEAMKGESNE